MQLGDRVKHILAPFVKGTKLEHCAGCERRRIWLNKFGQNVGDFIAKITCPCTYKAIWHRIVN